MSRPEAAIESRIKKEPRILMRQGALVFTVHPRASSRPRFGYYRASNFDTRQQVNRRRLNCFRLSEDAI